MNDRISFSGCSVVSCGTMRPELNYLKTQGFLDADKVLYTGPGLHDNPRELEDQLIRQVKKAKEVSGKVIVVFGKRCYLDMNDPYKNIEGILAGIGDGISRIQAGNCIDFLADENERERIRAGRRVYWLTPGWLLYWKNIFRDWDIGLANETFPQNDAAILLDPIDVFEEVSLNDPEKLLEFSDFMKIPIDPVVVTLDRLKGLLAQELKRQ